VKPEPRTFAVVVPDGDHERCYDYVDDRLVLVEKRPRSASLEATRARARDHGQSAMLPATRRPGGRR